MENKTLNCPKCKGEMEAGTITDRGNRWVGEGFIKSWSELPGNLGKFVQTFKCKNCGFLESYAT